MSRTLDPRTGGPVPIAAAAKSRVLGLRWTGLRSMLTEFAAFGGVGALCFVIDVGVFNLLRATVLGDEVVLAKVLSAVVATAVAWVGHRHVTFRNRRGHPIGREFALFAVSNLIGLGIAAGCLFVSHHVLGFTTPLADNIAGNVIGVALGTVFRYLAYRFLVFRTPL